MSGKVFISLKFSNLVIIGIEVLVAIAVFILGKIIYAKKLVKIEKFWTEFGNFKERDTFPGIVNQLEGQF